MTEQDNSIVPNDKFQRATNKIAKTAHAVESVLTVVTAVSIVVGGVQKFRNRRKTAEEI